MKYIFGKEPAAMSSHRLILTAMMLGVLSSCAAAPATNVRAPLNDARSLAQEQWDNCSHFPSVEFVEITSSGQLIVREKNASEPPRAYLRCVQEVAAKQVFIGKRAANEIVRFAYFTMNPPIQDWVSDTGGPFPDSVKRFDPDQKVTFFYGLEGLNKPVDVTLVWHSPNGIYSQSTEIFESADSEWTWATKSIDLPANRPGLWSVRMTIEGLAAGIYQFEVLKPSV